MPNFRSLSGPGSEILTHVTFVTYLRTYIRTYIGTANVHCDCYVLSIFNRIMSINDTVFNDIVFIMWYIPGEGRV